MDGSEAPVWLEDYSLYEEPLEEPVDVHDRPLKIAVMLVILVVSLFASSFPTWSKRASYMKIPRIAFFIMKHFGTGVILSTAFVHLLQDSMQTLLNPTLTGNTSLRHWAGLIVLLSLIAIFFVEYISTTYVERLEGGGGHHHHHHFYEDYPDHDHDPRGSHQHIPSSDSFSTIKPAHRNSQSSAVYPPANLNLTHTSLSPMSESLASEIGLVSDSEGSLDPSMRGADGMTERTNLLDSAQTTQPLNADISNSIHQHRNGGTSLSRSFTYGSASPRNTSREMNDSRLTYHSNTHSHPRTPGYSSTHIHPPHGSAEPFFSGHHRFELRSQHNYHFGRNVRRESIASLSDILAGTSNAGGDEAPVVVIAEANGEGDREGEWSAAVYATNTEDHYEHGHSEEDQLLDRDHGHGEDTERQLDSKERVGKQRQVVGILVLQSGIMIHSLVIGLTLAISTGSGFASLASAILFHQLFEGLSLGIRISSLPSSSDPETKHTLEHENEHEDMHHTGRTEKFISMKTILMVLFAITLPVGMLIGLFALPHGESEKQQQQMHLVQGLMSAISAGMLIYAACVEMLAGDFVMDQGMKTSSVRMQALALGSLLAGVVAMAIIG